MSTHPLAQRGDAVAARAVDEADAAIARVLAAERDARVAVVDCAQQAEREVQQARERARVVAARSAERTDRVHRAIERQLGVRLAEIDTQRRALAMASSDALVDIAALVEAVARLADELTRAPAPPEAAAGARPR